MLTLKPGIWNGNCYNYLGKNLIIFSIDGDTFQIPLLGIELFTTPVPKSPNLICAKQTHTSNFRNATDLITKL